MDPVEEEVESLAAECKEDFVGLWEVIHAAKHLAVTEDEVQPIALDIAQKLLERPGIIVGEFAHCEDGTSALIPWELSAEEAVVRIEQQWDQLGRTPDLGDVAYFASDQFRRKARLKRPSVK